MPRYLLSPHSYACESGGYGVFLDLKHDKYTAVSPDDVATLRETVEGWTAISAAKATLQATTPARPAPAASPPPDREDGLIRTLLSEGLLTADTSNGKPATPPSVTEVTTSLCEFPRPWPNLSTRHLLDFASAWAMTTLRLRALPISCVINRLRTGNLARRRQTAQFDMNKARLLTTIHFALQPAFYSGKDACLRNSLTLLEFLAKYDVYPTCVFGVKMDPFSAHAWVQHGAVVLTDPVEHIRRFTPIMVV